MGSLMRSLRLSLGTHYFQGRLVWPFEKNGTYMVKSRYHLAHARNQPQWNLKFSTLASIPNSLWNAWNLEARPKIRCFIWKTLHATIATMVNLFKRQSSPSSLCPLCNSHEESIEHLFHVRGWNWFCLMEL